VDVLSYLKFEVEQPYEMLYDLSAIDERVRSRRERQPASDFTVFYHLLSLQRNSDVRIKVPLTGELPALPSVTSVWPMANWYEREVWDMFGVRFEHHPNLRRILMPPTWRGHPLRKDHPARATEMGPFQLPDDKEEAEQEALQFRPEEWGLKRQRDGTDFLFLNLGPQHPGTHGVLRIILQLDGEVIVDAIPDIGYHHRGAEKMGERQTWHTYIPYTDRVDYLAGVLNNLSYLMSVECLAGITPPPRAQVIRVMMSELFRIVNHLVWYGTFAQDVGAMSPVFYMFNDRERAFGIVEAVTGARMHPSWFRIGGVAADLPDGWDVLVKEFIRYFRPKIAEYDNLVMRNAIFRARTKNIGVYTKQQAVDWGVTGPGLRATGIPWDLRKKRPYSGYEQFDFEVAVAEGGDCYARAEVRVEELRQSLRIIEQCVDNMPDGPYKSEHPLTTPPRKAEGTMHDIETLIAHFLGVSWGPVMRPGEAIVSIEGAKGMYGYYLFSDGGTHSYRTRIRTPSFAHMQMLPIICRGLTIPDLLAILGSMDYVLSDVDR
jgi:NADH-quinone oxidoreductase subunit C/D